MGATSYSPLSVRLYSTKVSPAGHVKGQRVTAELDWDADQVEGEFDAGKVQLTYRYALLE